MSLDFSAYECPPWFGAPEDNPDPLCQGTSTGNPDDPTAPYLVGEQWDLHGGTYCDQACYESGWNESAARTWADPRVQGSTDPHGAFRVLMQTQNPTFNPEDILDYHWHDPSAPTITVSPDRLNQFAMVLAVGGLTLGAADLIGIGAPSLASVNSLATAAGLPAVPTTALGIVSAAVTASAGALTLLKKPPTSALPTLPAASQGGMALPGVLMVAAAVLVAIIVWRA